MFVRGRIDGSSFLLSSLHPYPKSTENIGLDTVHKKQT